MSFAFAVLAIGYFYYDIYYRGSGDAALPSVPVLDGPGIVSGVVSTLWALTPTSTALPVSPVPSVTSTPGSYLLLPNTSTPVISAPAGSVYKVFLLSFYDPDIGRLFPEIALINCLTWDFGREICLSPMGDGSDHREFYWRSLACPKYYEYGTVFRVLSPSWLAGDWPCKDHGDLITDRGEYLDFLLPVNDVLARFDGNINNFPWSTSVETYVILNGVP